MTENRPNNQSSSPTHDTQALILAVRARAESLGYHVTRTPDGFTVERNLADARYWAPLHKASVHTVTGHEVRVDEAAGTVRITDVHRNVEWRAGNDGAGDVRPFWAAESRTTRGRILAAGTTKSWGVREDGTVGAIEDYSFNTNEGRDAVRLALVELGWREQMPLDQKIGLVVGIGTAILTALCFAIWGLVAILG